MLHFDKTNVYFFRIGSSKKEERGKYDGIEFFFLILKLIFGVDANNVLILISLLLLLFFLWQKYDIDV